MLVPIFAVSDKTPITRMTGGLKMHPLFISIGNIGSQVRMAVTSHAWQCVAFMPIPKFEVHSDYQTILQTHIWHKCVNIITQNLKCAAAKGTLMSDPRGHPHYCFTPLAAWTADLPEQLMIACIAKNASPITQATHKHFGDAECHPPQTAEETLALIKEVASSIDPWDLDHFQKAMKALFLSNIHLLFWQDWWFSDPSIFLVPEILHFIHKFFFNHVLQWCKEVVGADLDK